MLADNGFSCSMSRDGNVWDNSAMERFFAENRADRQQGLPNRDDARADVFDFIERLYSPRRCHSRLGYLSPMEFDARAMQA